MPPRRRRPITLSALSASPLDLLEPRRLFSFTPYNGKLLEQTVFADLTLPTAVEFAPDGRVFASEKGGIVRTYDSVDDTTGTVVLDLSSQVNEAGDRGLLGMALSPTFASDHYVYLLYTFDGDMADSVARTTYTDQPDATVTGKLVRYTYSNGALSGEHLLIHDWPQQFSSHSIGHVAFGPDGFLYASGGDGASFNGVDYGQYNNPFNDPTNEGGALRSQDILSGADPTGLNGTIIRIDPATAAGVSGNPFFASGDANKRRIIANGLRNPFRFTWRPGTSELWIGDVGWNDWEEVNRLTGFSTNHAPNFQWPAFEGNGPQPAYEDADLPLLQGLYNGTVPDSTAPFYTYNHLARVDVTNDANENVGGSSITGVVFHNAGSYPYPFDGSTFFFSDYARQAIYAMQTDSNGLPIASTARLMQTGVFADEMKIGPDGNVWYVDIGMGKVIRLTGKGPTARIDASVTSGTAPLTVNLSAANSNDPDVGDQLSYAWDLDNDGQFDDSTDVAPSKTFNSNGTFTIRLKVTDLGGLTDTVSQTIRVGSSVPVPVISTPTSGTHWKVGQTFTFSGSATDAEDGTLAASKLSWRVVLRHVNADNPTQVAHDHILSSFDGVTGGSFTTIDHDYPSYLELRLTATDSDGNSVTTVRRLDPQTVDVTIGGTSPGVTVAFDGRLHTTPFTQTVIQGSSSTIGVAAHQVLFNGEWDFDGWQDGGAVDALGLRNFTAPTSGSTAALYINGTRKGWRWLDGVPISGNAPAGNDTRDLAFDGDDSTGYRSTSLGGSIGIDFGTPTSINEITFTKLGGTNATMIGGRFEGSNKSDFSTKSTLYTFASEPTDGMATGLTGMNGVVPGRYRYLRYVAPSGSIVALAQMGAYAAVDAVDYGKRVFGSSPKSNSSFANVNDDRQSTSYTASKESGAWIAIDLGESVAFDTLRFAPDLKSPATMRGGVFQASNAADFANAVTVYSVEGTPDAGMHEVSALTGGNAYRYVRYVGRNGQASRISEFSVLGMRTPQFPAAPGAIQFLTRDAASGVQLAWSDRSIIDTGYRVRRSDDNGKTWKTVANLPVNTTTYADAHVTAGRTYNYRVYAMNAFGYGGVTSASTKVIASTTPPIPPSAPTLIETVNGVQIMWQDRSNNESGFRVDRRYSGDVWGTLTTVGANVTSYLDASSINNVTYEYRIVAINGAGDATGAATVIAT